MLLQVLLLTVGLLAGALGWAMVRAFLEQRRATPHRIFVTSRLAALPQFHEYPYSIVKPPPGAKLRAWKGLLECERRLAMCRWVREGVTEDPGPSYRLLVEDFGGAFIHSFEAALQFLIRQWNEVKPTGMRCEEWFESRPSHSLVVRGLRTIRRLAAHLETQPGKGETIVHLGFDQHPHGAERRHWLPEITPEKLKRVDPKGGLRAEELKVWSDRYGKMELDRVFEEALRDLTSIVADAEAAHAWSE